MTDTAIRVEGIGKLYRVGERESYAQLREVLANAFRGSRNGKRGPKDSIWAVRDVSFEVHQGEVVGLIGRNGAGQEHAAEIARAHHAPDRGRGANSTDASAACSKSAPASIPSLPAAKTFSSAARSWA